MGIIYIDGYKPRSNYQRSALPAAATAYLKQNPVLQLFFAADCKAQPGVSSVEDFLSALAAWSAKEVRKTPAVSEPGDRTQ